MNESLWLFDFLGMILRLLESTFERLNQFNKKKDSNFLFEDVMAKDDDSWKGKRRPLTTSDLARKDYPPSVFGTYFPPPNKMN